MSADSLVIFDCDGVLVDSERLAVKVDARVLTDLGWPMGEAEVVERFVGRSDSYMKSEIEKHLGRSLPDRWDESWQGLYREVFERELEPVPGIVAALDALDAAKRGTCVASSGGHEKMRFTLGKTGLYERFAGRIFSATEVSRGKPSPDLFLHAAARSAADPSRCVVVEDSRPGVEAARAAGMFALGYAGGVTPARELDGPRTHVFHDMADLPGLIDRHFAAL